MPGLVAIALLSLILAEMIAHKRLEGDLMKILLKPAKKEGPGAQIIIYTGLITGRKLAMLKKPWMAFSTDCEYFAIRLEST